MERWKSDLTDILKSIMILAIATGIGFLFRQINLTEANIIMVYLLSVMMIAVVTRKRCYSIISSVASVLIFNYFFTVPYFTLKAYSDDYPVTFLTMFLCSFITNSLVIQVREQTKQASEAKSRAENERLRSNLLRSISHDLRTPLTSISGNAAILLANADDMDRENRRHLYTNIYDDALWLIRLVENLLAVTRFENGTMELHWSVELVDDVVREALQHVNHKDDTRKIIMKESDNFLMAKIDAHLIMQVVINLVDNAIKYTPSDSEIHISVTDHGKMLQVEIADNGPGVPDEEKEKIFERFHVAQQNGIVDSRRSLGLGLSLCRAIVMAHGGEIHVVDNIPHGARFQFTLPKEEVTLRE
jgi:two-component system sensor histidine kinase KdpD